MKKYKIFLLLMTVISILFLSGKSRVYAMEEKEYNTGNISFDLNNVKVGDSIIVYEDSEKEYKVIVDVLASNNSNARDTGNSGWSGGSIPGGTHTLYPHIERNGVQHKKIGFTEIVKISSSKKEILDANNPEIETGFAITVMSHNLKINNPVCSGKVTAKASLNWIAKENVLNSTYNCYFMSEINSSGQHKLSWKF